jgi:hypothetical protein
MRFAISALALSTTLWLAASSSAQMVADTAIRMGGEPGAAFQMKTANVELQVETMDAAPIKGAPFCATISTEHTQHLADGNRIHTSESSQLCRDSEGRTRRESELNLLGAAPQASASKMITIVDPVAGYRYLLDTGSKTAQKMKVGEGDPAIVPDGHGKGDHVVVFNRSDRAGANVFYKKVITRKGDDDSSDSGANTETLGDQTFEGVHATGTRVTTTIPAGKMGNDKPIIVTSERWYSPELKVAVMTKHDDPWAGELKTEFKNVSTSEPDSSLFSVPADYKVIDDKEGPIRIELSGPSAPPQ